MAAFVNRPWTIIGVISERTVEKERKFDWMEKRQV